jgi:hypothetical protein
MSSLDVSGERATEAPWDVVADLRLEVVVLPVSDVDRAKSFSHGLGGAPMFGSRCYATQSSHFDVSRSTSPR